MSECVVRMEMPQGCVDCRVRDIFLCCSLKERKYTGISPDRPDWCPILCQLPEGHGRLVDAKRIEYELCEGTLPKKYCDFIRRVLNSENLTPTIVPAEEERSET